MIVPLVVAPPMFALTVTASSLLIRMLPFTVVTAPAIVRLLLAPLAVRSSMSPAPVADAVKLTPPPVPTSVRYTPPPPAEAVTLPAFVMI